MSIYWKFLCLQNLPAKHIPPVSFIRYVGQDMSTVKEPLTYVCGLLLNAPPEQYQPGAHSPTGSERPSLSQYQPAVNMKK